MMDLKLVSPGMANMVFAGLFWVISLTTCLSSSEPYLSEPTASEPVVNRMAIIQPGMVVGDEQAERWNRIVLLANPRISSGDTMKLSEAIRAAVPKLKLTILATVKRDDQVTGESLYKLTEVGVGYSVPIKEKLTIVTSESWYRLGGELDFYSRQMLRENEKQIATVKSIVQTSTLSIFDTPAIMLRDGIHKELLTRHLVWIDPKSGKMALAVWLLASNQAGSLSVADRTLRIVSPGVQEDRRVHVDGKSFILGFPSDRSFALEDLPPGADSVWTESARNLAALSSYTAGQLNDFGIALNQMLVSQ